MASLSFKKKLGFLVFFSSVSLIPLSHGAASAGDELLPSSLNRPLTPSLSKQPEELQIPVHKASALKASSATDIAKEFWDHLGSSVKNSFLSLLTGVAEDVEEGLENVLELLTTKFTTWVHTLDGQKEKSVRLGCLPPKPATLKALFSTSHVTKHQREKSIQFVARHILAGIPSCGDQGDLGACTGWSLKKAVQCAEALDPNKTDAEKAAISALFMYYVERNIEGTTDQDVGASLSSGLLALKTVGVADESKWPYNPAAFNRPPSSDAYEQARENMLLGSLELASIDPSDPDNIKAALMENKPVVFGMEIYENFLRVGRDGKVSQPKGRKIGGHALAMFGFDDNVKFDNGNKGAFLVQNHWSEEWGYSGPEGSGFCWFPYELSYLLFDVWAIGKIGHGQRVPSYSSKLTLHNFLEGLKSGPAASEIEVSAAPIANAVPSDSSSAEGSSATTSSFSRTKTIRTKVSEALQAAEEEAWEATRLAQRAKERAEELKAIQAELKTLKSTSSTASSSVVIASIGATETDDQDGATQADTVIASADAIPADDQDAAAQADTVIASADAIPTDDQDGAAVANDAADATADTQDDTAADAAKSDVAATVDPTAATPSDNQGAASADTATTPLRYKKEKDAASIKRRIKESGFNKADLLKLLEADISDNVNAESAAGAPAAQPVLVTTPTVKQPVSAATQSVTAGAPLSSKAAAPSSPAPKVVTAPTVTKTAAPSPHPVAAPAAVAKKTVVPAGAPTIKTSAPAATKPTGAAGGVKASAPAQKLPDPFA